jgi:tRNA pseudouridine55 synthase
MTSREVVDRVERWFPGHKVGHAGTLDPLATGVLVLAVGSATRLIEYVQRMSKTYRSVFRLGVTSDTDDADGRIQEVRDAPVPGAEAVAQALRRFLGEIQQVPPAYSAIHHEGKRAYQTARQGGAVELEPRSVVIYDIRIHSYEYPRLHLEIHCGKGTYIRSLARDLGQDLGCGAIVEQLERRRIGPFRLEHALPITASKTEAEAGLRPAVEALSELPLLRIGDADFARLCQGQTIRFMPGSPVAIRPGQECAVFGPAPVGVVVAEWQPDASRLVPRKVFADLPRPADLETTKMG